MVVHILKFDQCRLFQVFGHDKDICVVFFSPSGVQFALPVLKAVRDFASLKVWRWVYDTLACECLTEYVYVLLHFLAGGNWS